MSRRQGGRLPREVFLSHASKYRKAATGIARVLREHGVPVWYSQTSLVGAQQWHDEIGKALARCDWFLLLLSPSATRSPWVKSEILYALELPRFVGRILPMQYRACDARRISWTLSSPQTIDFSRDFAAGCQALLRTWGLGYEEPRGRKRGK